MKKLLTIMIIFSPLFLTGCFNSKEVDDMTYVMAIGAEKGAYTFQLALPLNISGDKEADVEQEDESSALYSVKIYEDNFEVATDKLNSMLSKTADLSHMSLFVFSTGLAKEGLGNFETILSDIKIRPSTYLTVADNPEKYLKSVSSPFELNPAKYFDMLYSNENRSFYESLTVHDFLTDEVTLIPVSSDKGYDNGSLILKDKKALFNLTAEEVFYYRILKGDLPLSHFEVNGQTYEIKSSSESQISCNGYEAHIKIYLDGNEKTGYKIKKGCENLLNKTKQEGIDLLSVQNKARAGFLTSEAFNSFDFNIKNVNFSSEVCYE